MNYGEHGDTPDFDRVKLAGFWMRYLALLIDSFILGFFFFIGLFFFFIDFFSDLSLEDYADAFAEAKLGYTLFFFFFIIVKMVYTILMEKYQGGTLGKIICGITIQRFDNPLLEITFGQAFGRYFASILSGIPFNLGYLWAAWDSNKQTWHDKLAGTIVLYRNSIFIKQAIITEPPPPPTPPTPIEIPMKGERFGEFIVLAGASFTSLKSRTLKGEVVKVGRGKPQMVHIYFDDRERLISKEQFEIVFMNQRYYLRPMSLKSYTKLNGRVVNDRAVLKSGDIVEFGNFKCKIVLFNTK